MSLACFPLQNTYMSNLLLYPLFIYIFRSHVSGSGPAVTATRMMVPANNFGSISQKDDNIYCIADINDDTLMVDLVPNFPIT